MPGPPPEILKRPGNRTCADCEARDPRWASVNLGIFICETCAGIHRDLGTHISKVKSIKLDEWKPEPVAVVRAIGNTISNAYYEHNVPAGTKYIGNVNSAGGDKIEEKEAKKLKTWIRAKYEEKKFAPLGVEEPRVRLANGESLGGPGSGAVAPVAADAGLDSLAAPEERSRRKSGGKEGKQRDRSRKSRKEKIASPEQDKAFAPLGAWAAQGPPSEAAVEAEGKEEKKAKKEKKSKRDRSRTNAESVADSTPGGAGTAGGFQMSPQSGLQMSPHMSQWGGSEAQGQQHSPARSLPQEPGGCGGCCGVPPATVGGVMQWEQLRPTGGFASGAGGYGSGGPPGADGANGAAVNMDPERRAALQAVARLLTDHQGLLGVTLAAGEGLLPLFGFDAQTAEFHHTALKKRREGDTPKVPDSKSSEIRSNGNLEESKDVGQFESQPPADKVWLDDSIRNANPFPATAAKLLDEPTSRLGEPLWGREPETESSKLVPMVQEFKNELQRLKEEMKVLQKDYGRLRDEKETSARSYEGGPRMQDSLANELRKAVAGGRVRSRGGSNAASDPGDGWWNKEPSGIGMSGFTSPRSAFSPPAGDLWEGSATAPSSRGPLQPRASVKLPESSPGLGFQASSPSRRATPGLPPVATQVHLQPAAFAAYREQFHSVGQRPGRVPDRQRGSGLLRAVRPGPPRSRDHVGAV